MNTHCKNCKTLLTQANRVEVHVKGKDGRGATVTIRGLCYACYMEQHRERQRKLYNAKNPQGPRKPPVVTPPVENAAPATVEVPDWQINRIRHDLTPQYLHWLKELVKEIRSTTNEPLN